MHAVCNTIFRRHLDGRVWMNDPDVFLLRDKNVKTDFEQRKLLARINSVFGSLLFISDNIDEYNSAQFEVLNETFAQKNIKIRRAEFVQKNIIEAEYTENEMAYKLKFNVMTGELYS